MAKRTNGVRSESRFPIHGLKACLDQLHDEAIAQGYSLAAVLIGAASEAVVDEELERAATTPARAAHGVH